MRLALVVSMAVVAMSMGCGADNPPPGEIVSHGFWSNLPESCPHDGPAFAAIVKSQEDIDAWFDAYTCDDAETADWVTRIRGEAETSFHEELGPNESIVLISEPYEGVSVSEVTLDGDTLFVGLNPFDDSDIRRTYMQLTIEEDISDATVAEVHWNHREPSAGAVGVGTVSALFWILGS